MKKQKKVPDSWPVYQTRFNATIDDKNNILVNLVEKDKLDFRGGVYCENKIRDLTLSSLETLIQDLVDLGLIKRLS